MIAVSYGGGLRQTVEGLRRARANGAHRRALPTHWSLGRPLCYESFLTSDRTFSFASSYVAPMAPFYVTVVAPANHSLFPRYSLDEAVGEEQRHGFRRYES